ncbi:hypothetical protein EVAR_22146_1 [Eumeta japonica]|uniref:Uncharacterized protein n=1 Tax=Eumeta variegata TaxID=151549 RepID=A0A4C1W130_EUMVA|nr:hypothetical protein EVAR_22146_1 [Eumeta japonica]
MTPYVFESGSSLPETATLLSPTKNHSSAGYHCLKRLPVSGDIPPSFSWLSFEAISDNEGNKKKIERKGSTLVPRLNPLRAVILAPSTLAPLCRGRAAHRGRTHPRSFNRN